MADPGQEPIAGLIAEWRAKAASVERNLATSGYSPIERAMLQEQISCKLACARQLESLLSTRGRAGEEKDTK
jgi:hypothetical protein